jgi:hypothetical protein
MPQPPPSPPPRAARPPRRSPEPSLPRRRPPHLRRRRRSTPSRRAAARVSLFSTPPAWRHPGTPPVLAGNTLPPASPHRAAVSQAASSARPGHQAVAQSAFWPAARGRPPCCCPRAVFTRAPQAVGRFEARHCVSFFNCLNSRNYPKLPKFIKTCRSVQKLQNNFF